jgi:tartrate dehydratase alpha subunit/fumarate hydratase class I-like protein
MNFTGLPDPIPFAESGAAVGVYERGEIERAIEEGLYDETVKAKLRENRDQFVYEQAFRKDGKATDRVVSLIEQMVQENRKCE